MRAIRLISIEILEMQELRFLQNPGMLKIVRKSVEINPGKDSRIGTSRLRTAAYCSVLSFRFPFVLFLKNSFGVFI